MSGDPLDFYDVQAMIRDERSEILGKIDNATAELLDRIRALEDDVAAFRRVFDARTERFV